MKKLSSTSKNLVRNLARKNVGNSAVKKIQPRKKIPVPSKNIPSDKTVITAALPYANGPIHLGHLLEYIQADIYTRFLKLTGQDALYICASDMHGTPVEVNAKKAGKDPEQFALEFWKEHQQDFAAFLIHFDNYGKTHSPENRKIVEFFYTELRKKKLTYTKVIRIIYCPSCARSLPDRYVRGTCPLCTTADQYGDICEQCSNVLKGIDLINPKCSLCGQTPVQKESEHYFFKLSSFRDQLRTWMDNSANNLQPEVRHWLQDWMDKGLEDWCISRDAPYFGFEIPDSKKETGEIKYFYVWLDAPIGYISSTQNYCLQKKRGPTKCDWQEYWLQGKVQHFIGKDISYFHFLFWPAMLLAMNIPVPKITVHGFVTVNGQKMSKTRGTFFTAKDFLKLYPAESLRFFYASRLDRTVQDVDFNFEEFKALNNHVLMGNLGNFCYRVLTFAQKNYTKLKTVAKEKEQEKEVMNLVQEVRQNYQQQDFKSAVRNILKIADLGNAYFQQAEPWKNKENAELQVAWCVNLARNLAIIVSPILPAVAQKVLDATGEKKAGGGKKSKTAMGQQGYSWTNLSFSWKGSVQIIDHLVEKIDKIPTSQTFPLRMVMGKIIEVKAHPAADKLYLLTVDLGKELGRKQVVAGLKKYCSPQQLTNRTALFCVNMKPARIRGEQSEAMILVADDGDHVSLLEADKSQPGQEANFSGMENSSAEVTLEEFKALNILIEKGTVVFESRKLAVANQAVIVHGVKDGGKIF